MDSNAHSTPPSGGRPTGLPDGQPVEQPDGRAVEQPVGPPDGPSDGQPVGQPDDLAALTALVDELAARDLDGLSEVVRAERVLTLRQQLDRLEGHWLKELAAVDAGGRLGPSSTNNQEQPRPGCVTGCGWGRGRPRAASGPPGPCSVVPWLGPRPP